MENQALLKLARNIGSTKIIILNSNSDLDYSIESDMGGSFVTVNFGEMDQVIKEIIFQEISVEEV